MPYLEKNFQRDFNKWCKYHIKKSSAFELKITKGNSLPFKAVKEHQRHALLVAKHKKLIWKIPDAGFQNPFDSFMLTHVCSYVVIMFNTGKDKFGYSNRTKFVMIDIDDFLEAEKKYKKKSINYAQAITIGTHCVLK